ncbi:MAG TPA: hypothetical protein PLR36_04880 [Ferruginibacter sp.]|nr:hypothetical protein [Ferruginibacter sp.]
MKIKLSTFKHYFDEPPNSISVLSPMFKLRLTPFTDASLPIRELFNTISCILE